MSTQTVPIVQRYSMLAQRTRKWERWEEPRPVSRYSRIFEDEAGNAFLETRPKARYFGLTVRVVQAMSQLAVIEWQGHRMVVEVEDLQNQG